MHRAIGPSGWGRSRNQEYAGGRSFTTNNSMPCGPYVRKCGGSCSRKARNTRPGNAPPDSCDRSDPGSRTAGLFYRPRTVSAPSGQLWTYSGFGIETQQQRRSPKCRRDNSNGSKKQVSDSRTKPKLQSRSEKSFKGAAIVASTKPGPFAGVLRSLVGQGHAAGDGAADPGQEDCHHRVDRVEERSELRRQISETTNSLSVSDRVRSISGDFSGGGRQVLETLWFESESQLVS